MFGGTHYPTKFTNELLNGKYALGTVIPKHALDNLDEDYFPIFFTKQNRSVALLDWNGWAKQKKFLTFLPTN